MARTVSCVNLKGGVGKTAIAVNFAAYCGLQGHKTLLVDVDPQTNATFSCIEPEKWGDVSKKSGTVANLLGMRNFSAEGAVPTAKDVIVPRLVLQSINLLLITLFREHLQGAQHPQLRKAISFAVSLGKHAKIKSTLGVTLTPPN